jgi:hypothetical protein
MTLIDAFLALDETGVPLCLIKSPDAFWNDNMATGVLSAIDEISSVYWQGSILSRLEFGEKQLYLHRDTARNRTFVLVTTISAPPEIAESCLTEMREKFEIVCLEKQVSGLVTSRSLNEDYSQLGHELLKTWSSRARKTALQTGEPHYQALYTYDEIKQREQATFILDKTILRVLCEAGTLSLSHLRQRIATFEEMLGERIDLKQLQSICERYVNEGLIKKL